LGNGAANTLIGLEGNDTLGDFVENLTLTGGAITGIGNMLDNVLVGNYGNNTLDGGVGADSMAGGTVNDTYIVDSLLDATIDTVLSLVTAANDAVFEMRRMG